MRWLWVLFSIVVIGVAIGLWQSGVLEKTLGAGLVEKFVAPWRDWASESLYQRPPP